MKGKEFNVAVPSHVCCPITEGLMKDSATLCTGLTYDRHSIETCLHAGNNVCPITDIPLHTQQLIRNHTFIGCVVNSARDIARNPTPKMPLNSAQVAEILAGISEGKVESIRKIRRLTKESNRNRNYIAALNIASAVASLFADRSPQAINGSQQSVEICEEALGTLALILHLNEHDQALQTLASSDAVACLVWILHQGNPEAKNNAVVLVQEMTSKSKCRERIGATDGLAEGLLQVLQESTCPATRKATIASICYIARVKKACVKLVEAGAVPFLLEILVDADRGMCERGLFALDILCHCTEGRTAAYAHALTVPIVVKKIMRVSDLASELAASVLWNICQHSSDGCAVKEALQRGAFEKLLILMQVGCAERTRRRASQLLKLLSTRRDEWECNDATNFNHVKRSFG